MKEWSKKDNKEHMKNIKKILVTRLSIKFEKYIQSEYKESRQIDQNEENN